MLEKSIELDCPPGNPRPGDLIGGVVGGLGLEVGDTVYRFFGNWKWSFDGVPDERWSKIQPVLKERITKLLNDGIIRYGSW